MLNKMLLAFVVLGGGTHAQSVGRPQYMDRAIVQHNGAVATVIANAPIPLYQAISAIREEYGWRVNWEQAPCYSHLDLVDDTAPEWRNAHPESKGVTRPAGGTFRSVFPEITESSVANAKEALEQIVSDYNATDNLGKYALRAEADSGRTLVCERPKSHYDEHTYEHFEEHTGDRKRQKCSRPSTLTADIKLHKPIRRVRAGVRPG